MSSSEPTSSLRVIAVTWEAEGVVGLRLAAADATSLPAWEPGAHIDLRLPSGLNRQYSLCGAPGDRDHYQVAVRLVPDSRGGSAEIHTTALAGRLVSATGPRNHFPLTPAARYLLVAGGIGVTPLLPMAEALTARDLPWSGVYCGRGAASMAFHDRWLSFGADRVRLVDTTAEPRPRWKQVIAELPADAAVYCCGPESLLDEVGVVCRSAGVRCETEYFGAASVTPADPDGDEAFEVELRRSQLAVTVVAGTTVLQAIRDGGVAVDSDCEEGYCGTCETAVLEGTPDHRDVVLSHTERAAGKTMMPCVSRACTRRLVLDL